MAEEGVHVVFGAGQVGSYLAESLLRSGNDVRVVKRSPSGFPGGVQPAAGDATDPSFSEEVTADAEAVYHCINPAYSSSVWAEVLPKIQENLVQAAGRASARLVVLENLYMLGRGGEEPLREDTPFNPKSRKGEIRARLAEGLSAAHQRGDVKAVSGRGSDFYGPRGFGTHFSDRFWKPVLAGKPAEFLPNPDTPHTYHYIPDVAEGLRTLGAAPESALGRPWMLPCAQAEPTRDLVARFSKVLGANIRLRGMNRGVLAALGLFMPMVREVKEMLHQWEDPFVVDDSAFRAEFGVEATALDEGAAATVAWARECFGRGS